MIVLLDMGIGNLSSVQSGFARSAGAETVIVQSGEAWDELIASGAQVSGLVLPGVGAFGDAMFQLRSSGLLRVVRQMAREGKPLLGICLGMQLLLSVSEEHGSHVGLGIIPGSVTRFPNSVKVPHMGWNDLVKVVDHPLLNGITQGDFVYFVHSYKANLQNEADLLAAADYNGIVVPAVIGRGLVLGTQFHPEKSGHVGEAILRNFVEICRQTAKAGAHA
ncbi:imidazole glycerol phosphate synthase subunit HisH [Alicyclobacillus ferrooxydans]|uniref:Imidazole glycerol phosphate synthase subunit HisH n=1 Tax=Alicyclobacillus ferrooxydans TaxID=471514 RepID=A0A0P9CDR1_9BACL|nr:imidazole glycerol phosphate synthase subunit HisH [Alicyclobacillus ferrooxydans]KPV43896.1 imidazole glycerol phosphate synthase [Alicyclobacillus ferrooxydans]